MRTTTAGRSNCGSSHSRSSSSHDDREADASIVDESNVGGTNFKLPGAMQSTKPSSDNPIQTSGSPPSLFFNQLLHEQAPPYSFYSREGFKLHDSSKSPPGTRYHVAVRDCICVSSTVFEGCVCKLMLKTSGKDLEVSSESFKPSTQSSAVHECEIAMPHLSRLRTGSRKSFKVAYIQVCDNKDQIVATSSIFWIRSRIRTPVTTDLSKKHPSDTLINASKRRKSEDTQIEQYCSLKSSGPRTESGFVSRLTPPVDQDSLPPESRLSRSSSIRSSLDPLATQVPQLSTIDQMPPQEKVQASSIGGQVAHYPLQSRSSSLEGAVQNSVHLVLNNNATRHQQLLYHPPLYQQTISQSRTPQPLYCCVGPPLGYPLGYPPYHPHLSMHQGENAMNYLRNEVIRLNSIVYEQKSEIDKLRQENDSLKQCNR